MNADIRCKAIAKNGKPCRAAATAAGCTSSTLLLKKAAEPGRI